MLRALAPGKVNLCLYLGGARADGRHELVTLFQPVSLADEVTLADAEEDVVVCPGVEGPNLAARALAELRARGWEGPRVRIEIAKRIPVAAGMAGGSADAAATLRLAAAAHPPTAGDGILAEVAGVLGADVPSQLAPGPALGTGAGDVVVAVPERESHAYLILPSSEALATPSVFAEADRLGLRRSADDLLGRRRALEAALWAGPELPTELIVNDLQAAACSLCPAIHSALEAARDLGADAALVCGSGPTVAGLFWGADAPARAGVAAAAGAEHFPGAAAVVPVDAGFASVRAVDRRPGRAQ